MKKVTLKNQLKPLEIVTLLKIWFIDLIHQV